VLEIEAIVGLFEGALIVQRRGQLLVVVAAEVIDVPDRDATVGQ